MISSVLTSEQLAKIHRVSLDILEQVGVHVPHEKILGRFEDADASVSRENQRVRIPPDLVISLVGKAGKQFTIYGRDTSKKAEFGLGKRNYNSIAGEAHWVDEVGQKRRFATLEDVRNASRLADALDCITIPGSMSDPHELSVEYRCVEVMVEMIRNTTKPIHFWFHDRASAKYIVEMMIALRGSEKRACEYPLCYPFLEPISPLR
ncbi:MAG: hypothetical protein HOC71_00040, partial [Candidatus Latescibacteria bacterium]|nr:hypothetical protein [Candidatus Latescibacterota bacterium]